LKKKKQYNLKDIKLVSFDFWNTLIFNKDPLHTIMKKAKALSKLTGVGREIAYQVIERIEKQTEKEREEKMKEISSEEVSKRIVLAIDNPRVHGEFKKIYDGIVENAPLKLEETAVKTLDRLKQNNKKIAILSNTSHGYVLKKILENKGVIQYFDFLIFSDEVTYRKPHPFIFSKLVELSGIKPQEIIHVGDRCNLDVEGAKNAGFLTGWYTQQEKDGCNGYDFKIKKLEDLINILKLV